MSKPAAAPQRAIRLLPGMPIIREHDLPTTEAPTMSPHRADPLISVALKSPGALLAQLAQLDTATLALGTGSAAGGLGWYLGGENNVGLVFVAALAILVDLATGALRAAADPNDDFTFSRLYAGVLGKLLRSFIVPIGALLDWALRLAFPSSGAALAELMPFTRLCLAALIGAELLSAVGNVRYVMTIPEALSRALEAMQQGNPPPVRPRAGDSSESSHVG